MISKLGDVCDITSSKRIFARDYRSSGIPFYRGKEIIEKQAGKNVSTKLHIEEERFEEIKRKYGTPEKGDLLLTSVGTLGVPYVVQDEHFYFKDGNLTWFRNFRNTTSKYIYYWLLSPEGRQQIDSKSIGSTQKALTIDALLNFTFDLPPLVEQCRIVDTLSALDAKIANNNAINHHLEQMAQAIFKSWFVDFEPFTDGGFVESELGEIPAGWRVGLLSELITIRYGKDHKKLSDGLIPVFGSGGVMRFVDTALYNSESVLIPRKGTLNNVIYVDKPFWSVDTMFYTEMNRPNIAKFVYFFVRSKDLVSMNAGSAVPSMTTEILNALPVVMPPDSEFTRYEEVVGAKFRQIQANLAESDKLATVRDSLLPHLMSGEIEVLARE